jgi:hypothetical protein
VCALGVLCGAKVAMAGTHGVVFIHGTGDYPGTFSCSGSGSGTVCTVPNAINYWTQGEIDSIRNGRAYAVVGFNGGSCAPWARGGEYGVNDPNSFKGTCNDPSGQGNGDVIASQIATFINTAGVTDLVIVTHSGGSNYARYILQNYTKNTNYGTIHGVTKRVVTIAATTLGTYLANEADTGVITSFIASMVGYGGEGVRFIRTDNMQTYNSAGSFFGGINNPVQGVNFYSTGGTSGSTCYGVKVWGVCVGVTGPTLGGSSCDSWIDDVGLLALHTMYLNTNDSGTARNSCSDGFISCMGAQRLGNNFAFNQKQDHNQSRRQCNGLDVQVRNTVSHAETGFSYDGYTAAQASPTQLDACGFSQAMYTEPQCSTSADCSWVGGGPCEGGFCTGYKPYGSYQCQGAYYSCNSWYGASHLTCVDNTCVTTCSQNSDCASRGAGSACLAGGYCGYAAGYTAGCPKSWLGDGYCDWDCVAIYGNDATPTWDSTGTKVTSWGSTSDCSNTSTGASEGVYAWSDAPFNGETAYNNADYTTYFTDPMAGGSHAISNCPQSLIGDGTCDECALALYGTDNNDCLPSQVTQCAGMQSYKPPYGGNTSNALSNNGWLEKSGGVYTYVPSVVVSISGVAGDGTCELGECGSSVTWPGTGQCATSADCASGFVCTNGGCSTSASGNDCSVTYGVPARTCATNADCTGNSCVTTGTCSVSGNTCKSTADCTGGSDTCANVTSTCLITGESCTGDSSCSVPSGATSTCGSGVCSCTSSSDCSGGAACNSGTCAQTITTSLCR